MNSLSLSLFFAGYLECLLWSTPNIDSGKPIPDNDSEIYGEFLDADYSSSDFTPEALEEMTRDCQTFITRNHSDLLEALEYVTDESSIGHDFWLTRNRHGSGFWDRYEMPEDLRERLKVSAHSFGECDILPTDDGRLSIF